MQLNEVILTNSYLQFGLFASLALVAICGLTPLLKDNFLNNTRIKPWIDFLEQVALKPFLLLMAEFTVSFFWEYVRNNYGVSSENQGAAFYYLINLSELVVIYWLIINIINWMNVKLTDLAISNHYSNFLIFIPSLTSTLKCITFLSLFNMLLPLLHLNVFLAVAAEKITHILLILSTSWIIYKLIASFEKFVINKYISETKSIPNTRKIHTQVTILKRVLVSVLMVVTFSAILMGFDSIKSIGTNLLTTAGIISAVAALASQQSLGRIFAGLQIAITQPIRIGDSVVIENEFGVVEEITLSFITIKLWDLRRLILPTDHFLNKGVLNLTRESSELLGTVFLYTDYTLPIQDVRDKFLRLLEKMPLWNKKVAQLDVTDIKEHSMEIRCLVSADNASDLWKLRCEIREEIMKYIVKKYFNCLSRQRSVSSIEKSTEPL